MRVPVLDVEGWYDAFLAGGIENFTGMVKSAGTPQARTNQRLVIGPWDHVDWGRGGSEPAPLLKDIGSVGESPINELMLAWYDHFLKGIEQATGLRRTPRVDYFVMGANTWKSADSWPLPQTRWSRYFLSGDGQMDSRSGTLSTMAPPADQAPDHYALRPDRSRPQRWAGIRVAAPARARRVPTTRPRSSSAPMSWCTAAIRSRQTPR